MREVAATGDLTRKIAVLHASRWDDEDARLLATTFNTLTDSIARFQREMSQKERLSSLGRLSTVIAHEVRNPLMIIKASLHSLRQPELSAGRACARRSPTSTKRSCGSTASSTRCSTSRGRSASNWRRPISTRSAASRRLPRGAAAAGPAVHLDLDATLPAVTTDPERLRIALVNMLVNARHAVGGSRSTPREPRVSHQHARAAPTGRRSSSPIRARASTRRPAARLRSILHDQARRHRPGPGDRQEHHRRPGRHDRRDQHAGTRHRNPDRALPAVSGLP